MKLHLISPHEAPDALSDGQAPQPPYAVGALRQSLSSRDEHILLYSVYTIELSLSCLVQMPALSSTT